MIKLLKDGLLAAFLAVATMLLIQASYVLTQLQTTADQVAAQLYYSNVALITAEGRVARATEQIAQAASFTATNVRGFRLQLLDTESGLLGYEIPGFLQNIYRQVDYSASVLTLAAADLHRAVDGLTDVTGQAAQIASKFDSQFMTCQENPGCLHSRWLAMSGEAMRTMDHTRRTMQAIELATPGILASAQRNSENMAKLTDRWTAPKTKLGKVKEGASLVLLGCRILC